MAVSVGIEYDSQGTPIYGRNAKGEPICAYQLRGTKAGKICRVAKVFSNGRCWRHGGHATEKGITQQVQFNPHSRATEISKRLTPKMRHVFQTSMEDPTQQSLSPEIALMDMVIARMLDQLHGTVPDLRLLKSLSDGVWELGVALETGDLDQVNTAYTTLTNMVQRGVDEERIRNDLRIATLQRAQLVEADSKRMAQARLSLNAADAESLVVTIFRLVTKHVQNSAAVRAIQADFVKYLAIAENRLSPQPQGQLIERLLEEDNA